MIIWKQFVCSVRSGVDVVNSREVLRGPLVGIVSVVMQYHLSSTALIPQLHLWHLHWLVCVRSVGHLHSHVL
jgi:hypothetical protein